MWAGGLGFTFIQLVDVHWHLLVYYTTDGNLHNTQIKDKKPAMEKWEEFQITWGKQNMNILAS